MEVVEDEDQHAGEQDEKLHRHLEERVEQQREAALLQAAPREIPLHLALVAAEVGQHQEEAPHESAPERVGRREAGRRIDDRETPGGASEGQGVAEADAFGKLCYGDAHAEEDAEPDEEHLDDVGPDDRLVPPVDHVDDGRSRHEEDRRPLVPAQDHRENEGRRVEGDPHRQPAGHQEEEAREGPGPAVEALLEVLVGREHSGAIEEGDQGHAEDDHGEGQPEVHHEESHAVGVGLARGSDEGDGADLRGHHRQADRPPPHLAPGQEEVGHLAVAAAHVDAEGGDSDEIEGEDAPVEGRHVVRIPSGRRGPRGP